MGDVRGCARARPALLVQAAAAGGIAVLAIGGARLTAAERVGVTGALCGLALLGLSLGSHPPTSHGAASSVAVWMIVSVAAAALVARVLPRAAGLGTAAGILYAAGDVGTKGALGGGARLLFVPALLACHGVAFVCMQLAFQRGGRLASAGLAVLWTNALPIVAGMLLFGEVLPGGWPGGARIAAFALVVVGAVALSRREPGADMSGGLTPGRCPRMDLSRGLTPRRCPHIGPVPGPDPRGVRPAPKLTCLRAPLDFFD